MEILEDRLAPAFLTVTSSLDDNVGNTLRNVLAMANAAAAAGHADTIGFQAGVTSIALTQGNLELKAGAQVTIDGGGLVTGLTLAQGSAGQGGGISNSGTLTLTNCIASGNNASGPHGGGGIYNGQFLTLTNTTIFGNTASLGGGLYNANVATLTNSAFSGNSASPGGSNSGLGGGIYNHGAVTLTSNTISSNNASQGGGIFNAGSLTLSKSMVSGNNANASPFHLSAGDGLSNSVAVRIRSGTIVGPILGTSRSVTVGDRGFGSEGVVNFTFATPISLTPGNVYVIELIDLSGPANVEGLGYTQSAPYGSGRAIVSGKPDPSTDFYFSEGLSVLPITPVAP